MNMEHSTTMPSPKKPVYMKHVMSICTGFAITAMTLASLALPSIVAARSRTSIDPAKTNIAFEIDAVGWPTTRGKFGVFTGSIEVDLDKPSQSSVVLNVNATSVDAGSSGMTSYIKSEVMLNVEKFPQISFRSTSVEKTGERSVKVTGDMNFYGTVLPATFNVDVDKQGAGKVLVFTARGTIKRSEFGLISGQPLISDDVKITVSTIGRIE
jgi:polyisoprenoid-binding protein YceI